MDSLFVKFLLMFGLIYPVRANPIATEK